MKHTPGPWLIENTKTGGTWINTSFAGFSICHLIGQPEIKANAALIAAAPEMLEALEVCISQIEEFSTGIDSKRFAIQIAKEAIAKSRGEK